jgi:putative FmdB family regulatory protein
MPIYEYDCRKCGHGFEALQRMSDRSCPPCEKCGSRRTARKFSTFAMHGSSRSSGPDGGGHAHGSGCSCGGCGRKSCSGCRH